MATGTVLSFPQRGPWGDAGYGGNCSGYVYRESFRRLHPRVFTDPMVASGTSVQVAREMGIEAYGLDLHSGFNILKQDRGNETYCRLPILLDEDRFRQ
jgi:hypothetical protein